MEVGTVNGCRANEISVNGEDGERPNIVQLKKMTEGTVTTEARSLF